MTFPFASQGVPTALRLATPATPKAAVAGENVRPRSPLTGRTWRRSTTPPAQSSVAPSSLDEQLATLLRELALGVLREAALAVENEELRREVLRLRRELGIPTLRPVA